MELSGFTAAPQEDFDVFLALANNVTSEMHFIGVNLGTGEVIMKQVF
jgi:hypothetical protein